MSIVITFSYEHTNQSLLSSNRHERFQQLQTFFEDYQEQALKHYYSQNKSTDPMGYTRYILTSLKILRWIHIKLSQQEQFTRLKTHQIQIPNLFKLFQYLILPTREEMEQARRLYEYFHGFSHKPNPHLLDSIDSDEAFGVVFADKSEQMNNILAKIRTQIEQNNNDKSTKLKLNT